jgi:hypothetical protein
VEFAATAHPLDQRLCTMYYVLATFYCSNAIVLHSLVLQSQTRIENNNSKKPDKLPRAFRSQVVTLISALWIVQFKKQLAAFSQLQL